MSDSIRVTVKTPEAKRENGAFPKKMKVNQVTHSPTEQILFLQRTIGNRAIEGLIRSGVFQAKLKISQPGDKYEREADRVAKQITSPAPMPAFQRKCNGKTPYPLEDEKKEVIQPKTELPAGASDEIHEEVLKSIGAGIPMDNTTRAFYESRFGHDFSQVRLHTDEKSAESAKALSARAFTLGKDVVFGAGQYSHGTLYGRQLLAHELMHVIQQRGSRNILNRWTMAGVLKKLCPTSDKWIVDKLKLSKVYQVDKIVRNWKIYEKTKTGGKGKFVKIHSYELDGLASSADKKIWVRTGLKDNEASSTFFHEVTHQDQPTTTPYLEKEFDAWIKEEEFRIRHGLPETSPVFRRTVGGVVTANEAEIKKFVKEHYEHRDPASPYIFDFYKQDEIGVKEVKGWDCPKP